jgi:hypothetical protein
VRETAFPREEVDDARVPRLGETVCRFGGVDWVMPSACRTFAIKCDAQFPRFWGAPLPALPERLVAGRGAAEPRADATRRSNEVEGVGGESSVWAIAVAGAGGAVDGVTGPDEYSCCVGDAGAVIAGICCVLAFDST